MGPYKLGAKPLTRSKTLWTAAGTFAASAGILVAEFRWPGLFGAEVKAAASALVIAALAFGALRFKTSAPVQ